MTQSQRLSAWIIGILVLIAFVFLLAYLGNRQEGSSLSVPVNSTDHVKGNPDGTVVLVEYSDFECPACASANPLVEQLQRDYTDLRVVYRHFPLTELHPNATLAAQAAEAAALQEKFWLMHDALFNTQTQWSELPSPKDFFLKLAASIGLDEERFRNDLESNRMVDAVKEDVASANASNVNATPTFFLNGKKVQDNNQLEAAIAALHQE